MKAVIFSLALLLAVSCSQQPVFDRFGGYTAIRQPATGYFSLGSSDGRHYLFTPEGNAFFSLGINHFHTTANTDYDGMTDSIRGWGFNSGCYQGPRWMWERIPYSKGINFVENRSYLPEDQFTFEDVFDPVFLDDLERRIRKIVEPQAENEMLIGYFLTDMPVWTKQKHGMGWIDFFASLDEESEGAKVYRAWKNENPGKADEEFLPLIAGQLYEKGIGFIRKYDPNHLIFSERYNEYDFSEAVVKEILPFVDAIATQPSNQFHPEYFASLYAKFGLPVFVADHVSSFATEEYPVTMGQVAQDEESYLAFYSGYLEQLSALPYVIGFNKCQYENELRSGMLKQGLVRRNGEPYDYVRRLEDVHLQTLYSIYGIEE